MRGVRNSKGQVTVFIIIAIVIVVAGILIYSLVPGIKGTFSSFDNNPKRYIQDCLEDDLEDMVESLSLQGGFIEPSLSYRYQSQDVGYLCYTAEDNKFCAIQVPFLKKHMEEEIENEIEDKVESCFNSLEEDFENKGYEVLLKEGDFEVEILPRTISLNIYNQLTVEKKDTVKYDEFNVVVNNNLYELIGIANSILEKEAHRYGDVETLTYMVYYKDLKLQKLKQSDETKIYILTDKKTGDIFQFASRSMAKQIGWNY